MITAETVLNPLLKNINREYKRLLTDLSIEWSREFDKSIQHRNKQESPTEQVILFRNVGLSLSRHIRRDTYYEEADLQGGLNLLSKLKHSREKKGFDENRCPNEEHPSLLALESQFLMLQWKYAEAADMLRRAIEFGNSERYKNKFPVVTNMFCRTYCLSQFNIDEAIEQSNECRALSESIGVKSHWKEHYRQRSLAPVTVMDPRIFGRLSELDALVHHPEWVVGQKIEGRFQKLWEDAVRDCDFPRSWRTDIKVTILSDNDWAERVPGYAVDVGKGAYIELGGNAVSRITRHIRATYGGFDINYSTMAPPLLCMICVGFLSLYGPRVEAHEVKDALRSDNIEIVLNRYGVKEKPSEVQQFFLSQLTGEQLAMTVRQGAELYVTQQFGRPFGGNTISGGQTTEGILAMTARQGAELYVTEQFGRRFASSIIAGDQTTEGI